MAFLIKPYANDKPQETALIDEFGTTTWSELNRRSNQLLHGLRAIGLKPGDVLSVLSGNRREYFEVLLAAYHGGWLVVPVNWHLVDEEVAYILGDSGSRVLIADDRFSELMHGSIAHPDARGVERALLFGSADEDGESYEQFMAPMAESEPEDQQIGTVMFYTSGTTGRPKGVRSVQFQVGVSVETLRPEGQETPKNDGTTLLAGPIYHSAQLAFSFLPLLSGRRALIRQKFDAAETLELIDTFGVTHTHLVPTQFIRMLRLDADKREAFSGESIDTVWHGAAPCSPDVKRQMIEWWGPVLTEYYGSTEGSIVTVVTSEDWLKKPGTVGPAIPSCEILIIGDDDKPAKAMETGQIYVRSLQGSDFRYHNDQEKTEKAHLEPGVYTFGDMGYLDEDGYLFLSDRKIDMIISGGVNIYPAEIEAALLNHSAVLDAAVFGIPNDEFGEEVKAVLELRSGITGDDGLRAEIEAHCREHLAGYKVPRSMDFVDQLPRTPTGKLLKRLLRDPYWKDRDRKV